MSRLSLPFIAVACFIAGIASVKAQSVNRRCGIDAAWQQAIERDPSLVQRRQEMEARIDAYIQRQKTLRTTGDDNDSIRIIPTVFHIMHNGGEENIPDANIRDCVQRLNIDYRRHNADTVNTFPPFKSVGADCKIQFRLATKDPNGHCTNGITRTYTNRTNGFGSFDQDLIDWPPDKYMNVWVVHDINGGPIGGETIGYAAFPLTGFTGVDGVVLKYDFVGALPPAQAFYEARDADHEIGHYFNLIHIWGDADCGDDKCADTPTQEGPNYGCPAFPHITCGNNGDMSDNYMDYTDGDCKDIYTLDQKARMRATLNVARFNLWQPDNLRATGTDDSTYAIVNADSINPPCAPRADFFPLHGEVCTGSVLSFSSSSYVTNGTPTAWTWHFPGSTTPVVTNNPSPSVIYQTPGSYPVTLTVSNATGRDSIVKQDVVIVENGHGVYNIPSGGFSEGFEGNEGNIPWAWSSFNDDGGPGWQRTNRAAYSGSYSMSVQGIDSFAPGSVKELNTLPVDFTHVTNAVLSFRMAYGQYFSGNLDSLSIRVSFNCGFTWSEIKHFGTVPSLSAGSGGFQPNNFAPTSNQWQYVQIPIPTIYQHRPSVQFQFYFKTDLFSNNLYIDDINISGVVGVDEAENSNFSFSVNPNPASESFALSYNLMHPSDLTIGLYDLQGRLIRQLESSHESSGTHENRIDAKSFHLASGVYIIKMTTLDGEVSKKLVYTNN